MRLSSYRNIKARNTTATGLYVGRGGERSAKTVSAMMHQSLEYNYSHCGAFYSSFFRSTLLWGAIYMIGVCEVVLEHTTVQKTRRKLNKIMMMHIILLLLLHTIINCQFFYLLLHIIIIHHHSQHNNNIIVDDILLSSLLLLSSYYYTATQKYPHAHLWQVMLLHISGTRVTEPTW